MSEFGSSYVRWVRSLLPEGTSLTVPRAALLGVLAAKGERILMGELGELLGVSPRNVTVIVDGLEHEKLVTRVAHERDRRATFVEITPAGKEVAAQVLAPHQNRVAGLFDTALTASECAQLAGMIGKLLNALNALISVPKPKRQSADSASRRSKP